jgi:NADH:ubiquinone oxidoreductase subunit 4 (subunit M)
LIRYCRTWQPPFIVSGRGSTVTDVNGREFLILLLLAASVLWMGIYPKPVTNLMDASVKQLIEHVQRSKLPAAAAAQ